MIAKQLLIALLAICCIVPTATARERASIGLQAGLGVSIPTASLADNFGTCATFGGGLTAGYGPLQLSADIAYGQPSLKRRNIYSVFDAAGRDAQIASTGKPSLLRVGMMLSVAVCRVGRLTIRPAVGVAYHRYRWDLNDIAWDRDDDGREFFTITQSHGTHLGSWSWLAAAHFDIRLHERYRTDLLPADRMARLASFLRITPQVAGARYRSTVPAAKGVFVGLSVSYFGLLSAL